MTNKIYKLYEKQLYGNWYYFRIFMKPIAIIFAIIKPKKYSEIVSKFKEPTKKQN